MKAEGRRFGLSVGLAFLGIGVLFLWRGRAELALGFFAVGIPLVLAGLARSGGGAAGELTSAQHARAERGDQPRAHRERAVVRAERRASIQRADHPLGEHARGARHAHELAPLLRTAAAAGEEGAERAAAAA